MNQPHADSSSGFLPDGWHLDRRISFSHIFTTLSVAVAAMVWLTSLEQRVTVSEVKITAVEKAYEKAVVDQSTQYVEIIRRLESLQSRLDSKIDGDKH